MQHKLSAQVPTLASLLQDADHMDVKTVTGPDTVTVADFVGRMFSYQPAWLRALFGIRQVFARLLRIPADHSDLEWHGDSNTVPMTPGAPISFLRVKDADPAHYWIGEAVDKHLNAWLAVIVEDAGAQQRRFHFMTIVQYNNWAGPVYFNVIRPFHHLVVAAMARYAVRS